MTRKLRILLADDSRFFRTIERQFLQKTPVEILEAEDFDAAWQMTCAERPDLVYLAFSLPGGGIELCRRIKAEASLRGLPVVLVCDQGGDGQAEAAGRAGCDATLTKPLDRHGFLQVGRRFLEGIREHRQPSFFRVALRVAGEEIVARCLDLSGGGMFIETPAEPAQGSEIILDFKLPDTTATRITCRAEVSWLNRKPNPFKPHYPHGLGVRFIDLSPSAHAAILRLTDKNS